MIRVAEHRDEGAIEELSFQIDPVGRIISVRVSSMTPIRTRFHHHDSDVVLHLDADDTLVQVDILEPNKLSRLEDIFSEFGGIPRGIAREFIAVSSRTRVFAD